VEEASRTRAGPISRNAAREGAKLAKGGAKGMGSGPHGIAAVRPIHAPYPFDSATIDDPAGRSVFASSWRTLRLCARPLVRSAGCRRASASAKTPVPSLQCHFFGPGPGPAVPAPRCCCRCSTHRLPGSGTTPASWPRHRRWLAPPGSWAVPVASARSANHRASSRGPDPRERHEWLGRLDRCPIELVRSQGRTSNPDQMLGE
jgi:hypothetical protein